MSCRLIKILGFTFVLAGIVLNFYAAMLGNLYFSECSSFNLDVAQGRCRYPGLISLWSWVVIVIGIMLSISNYLCKLLRKVKVLCGFKNCKTEIGTKSDQKEKRGEP